MEDVVTVVRHAWEEYDFWLHVGKPLVAGGFVWLWLWIAVNLRSR